LLCPGHKLQVN